MTSPALVWVLPIAAGLAAGALAVYLWLRRAVPGAALLSGGMASIAVWSITAGFEYRSRTLAGHHFWLELQFPAIALTPVFCFLLTLVYVGHRPGRRMVAGVLVVPFLAVIAHLTDPWFHLYWSRVWLETHPSITILGRVYGPFFWIFLAYSYALTSLSAVLLVRRLAREPPGHRKRTTVFLGSLMIPWAANAVYVFDWNPVPHFDITPYAFVLTGLGLTWVLFRGRFQAIVPVAWSTVVSSLPDGVIVLNEDRQVADLNPAAERLLGRPRAAAVGRDLHEACQARPGLADRLGLDQFTLEDNGAERTYGVRETPVLGRGGETVGRVLVVRDITAERAAARELEQAKRAAEAAAEAKTRFLANMSHEIRTPMNGVLGLAQLLSATGLSSEQEGYARAIMDSARSLLVVLNDILDFSKIDAGKLELESVPTNVPELLAGLVRLIEPLAREKGIETELRCSPDLPPWVEADPARLRQVLLNLLGNAVKFTPAGRVVVSAESRGMAAGRAQVALAVSDTGIGIPPEKMGLLFQDFSQADSSVARRHGGTGLGLAISRRLVEAMGGSIEVESRPGCGSTFTVSLSLPLAAPARAPEPAPKLVFPGRRILLVEDNAVNRLVGRRVLENLQCQVDVAVNGAEALQLASANGYDLVFMDCQMPGVDGLEATRRLRQRGVATPIVALTASVLDETRRACAEAGMNDYLAKPVEMHQWTGTLARWLAASPAPVSAPRPAADR